MKFDPTVSWSLGLSLVVAAVGAVGTYSSVHSKDAVNEEKQNQRISAIEKAIAESASDSKEIIKKLGDIGLKVNTLEANSGNVKQQISEMREDIKYIKRQTN